jgi:hypothetical protein
MIDGGGFGPRGIALNDTDGDGVGVGVVAAFGAPSRVRRNAADPPPITTAADSKTMTFVLIQWIVLDIVLIEHARKGGRVEMTSNYYIPLKTYISTR